jgi:hypothetical protein
VKQNTWVYRNSHKQMRIFYDDVPPNLWTLSSTDKMMETAEMRWIGLVKYNFKFISKYYRKTVLKDISWYTYV